MLRSVVSVCRKLKFSKGQPGSATEAYNCLVETSVKVSQSYPEIFDYFIESIEENEKRDPAVFHHLMEMANKIGNENPLALLSLVKLILRPLQAEHLLSVAEVEQHKARNEIDGRGFFASPDFMDDLILDEGRGKICSDGFLLDLASDVVMPTPWVRDRLTHTLGFIGSLKNQQVWRQDGNHLVSLWLPWRIGFVNGGNHSIAAGVISGKGSLKPRQVRDMSFLFDIISCDGSYFYRHDIQKKVRVKNSRHAAVFEIGRLMVQLSKNKTS